MHKAASLIKLQNYNNILIRRHTMHVLDTYAAVPAATIALNSQQPLGRVQNIRIHLQSNSSIFSGYASMEGIRSHS